MKRLLLALALGLASPAGAQLISVPPPPSTPTGAAGGALTGTYPNPTIAASATITTPVLSGTITGTYTLGGTPTIATPTITGVTTLPNGASISAGGKITATGGIVGGGGIKSTSDGSHDDVGIGWAASGTVATLSTGVIGFTSSSTSGIGAPDTAFSRDAAGAIDVGTGAQGSKAGSLNLTGINFSGNLTTSGSVPTVTGTGSPTLASGSSDTSGEATGGTLATSIIVTFAVAKTNAPFCNVTSQSSLASFGYTISTTAITISLTATTGEKVDYTCIQH